MSENISQSGCVARVLPGGEHVTEYDEWDHIVRIAVLVLFQ